MQVKWTANPSVKSIRVIQAASNRTYTALSNIRVEFKADNFIYPSRQEVDGGEEDDLRRQRPMEK